MRKLFPPSREEDKMVKYTFKADLLTKPLGDFFQPKSLRRLPVTHECKVWLNMVLAQQHDNLGIGKQKGKVSA